MINPPASEPGQGYPLLLDLTGRRVLVVGGGRLAGRRVPGLLAAGARVHVVAPQVAGPAGTATVVSRREFADADVEGAWLVLAATDDPAVNARIAEIADDHRVFCVRGDDARGGSARTPAVARRGPVVIAVSGGDDPGRAMALRSAIAAQWDAGRLPDQPVRTPVGHDQGVPAPLDGEQQEGQRGGQCGQQQGHRVADDGSNQGE